MERFVNRMNSFGPDVNIYFGHQVFDAKSFESVSKLQLCRIYDVELVSDNLDLQVDFNKICASYRG